MLEKIKNIDKRIMVGGAIIVVAILTLLIVFIVNMTTGKDTPESETETEIKTNTTTTEDIEEISADTAVEEITTDTEEAATTIADNEDKEDPEPKVTDEELGDGESIDINDLKNVEIAIGIDVSRYQGTIDWEKVADSGISFAMIRVGYRTTKTGEIMEDPYAKYNIVNALSNGIDVGVYFFSSAITEAEAKEEADWLANYISGYNITYPVAYNCENYSDSDSRQSALTKDERSTLAITFLDEIKQKGYTPMFYASKYEMENNAQWNITSISGHGKVWVAYYPDKTYLEGDTPAYAGEYDMWQYTSKGTVDGIDGAVDVNVSYLGIKSNGTTENTTAGENVTVSPEANMNFQNVNESVTAKIEVNLRNIPSQGDDSTVIATIKNGEIVTRTGTSPSGWSRLEYNGQVCYAVSSYLTTDTNPTTNSTTSPDIETTSQSVENETTTMRNQFTEVNIQVTAKEEVNLRNIPSVTDSEVIATLKNGEVITKTGVSDLGWARVIYNGQTLYCIDSYLQNAE